MRGESDRLVDSGLDEGAAVDLVARGHQSWPGYAEPNPGYAEPKPGYAEPKPGYAETKPSAASGHAAMKASGYAEMNRQLAAIADRMLSRPCRPVPAVGGSVALYRAITHGARAIIVTVHPGSGWTALSDSFNTVLGYDRHDPPDDRLLDLIHPDDRAIAMEAYLICCSGRHPAGTLDLRVRAADGDWRTMEVVARTFIDGGHRICLADAAAYRLLDAPDSHARDWDALLDGLADRLAIDGARMGRLREAVYGERAVVGQEVPFVDGRVLELDFVPVRSDQPVRDESGGLLVHVRDITARVAVRRGLEERSRGLEERNRALVEATALNNQFVATVSHELRGPLSSVVAFSHLLGDAAAGDLSEDQRTYLDVIDRNANRLLRLIEDLLLLSRLESRTLQLKPALARLTEILSVAVAERRPAALAAEIELRLECPTGPR